MVAKLNNKNKRKIVGYLVVGVVAALILGVVVVGLFNNWFSNKKITLDNEYYCNDGCEDSLLELSDLEYEKLVDDKGTFLIFVDQNGCNTADDMRGFVENYSLENGIKFYRMMFEDLRNSNLHEQVKFYPSVVIVENGEVKNFLKADSDDNKDAYEDYEFFEKWLDSYI